MHMQAIIKAFRSAATLAVQHVKDSSISIAGKDEEEKRDMLQKCASTTLNSKLVGPSPISTRPFCAVPECSCYLMHAYMY